MPTETTKVLQENAKKEEASKYDIVILKDKESENNKSGSNVTNHSNYPSSDSVTSGAGIEPDKDSKSQNEDENNG